MVAYPFSFKVSSKVIEYFKAEKIYLEHHNKIGGVHEADRVLVIHAPAILEKYATLPKGSFLSIGSFSYVLSRLDPRASVGRYCSIAKGCEVLGIEHPTDWISTHLFTFRGYWRDAIMREYGRAPDIQPFKADRGVVTIGNDVRAAVQN